MFRHFLEIFNIFFASNITTNFENSPHIFSISRNQNRAYLYPNYFRMKMFSLVQTVGLFDMYLTWARRISDYQNIDLQPMWYKLL